MAAILTKCPKTARWIHTGIDSNTVVFETLPNVSVPVRCTACDTTHYWTPADAWVAIEHSWNGEVVNRNVTQFRRRIA
jgi:hypothetical protein